MTSTQTHRPTCFLYCCQRDLDCHQQCAECSAEWVHAVGPLATCPQCGHQQQSVIANPLEAQREQLMAYYHEHWTDAERPALVVVAEDAGVMKSFDQREHSSKLLALAERGDYLIVTRMNRAWPSSADCIKTIDALHQRGVTVIVTEQRIDTSVEEVRQAIGLLVGLEAMSRRHVGEATAATIAAKKQKGLYAGNHLKFGTRAVICDLTGMKLVVDDLNELRMAKWVYVMRFQRRIPWEALVPVAEKLGFRNRAGKRFTLQKLKDLGTDARQLKAAGKFKGLR